MRIGGTLYHGRVPDGGAETSPLSKHPTFLPERNFPSIPFSRELSGKPPLLFRECGRIRLGDMETQRRLIFFSLSPTRISSPTRKANAVLD
jgi:hypothetical protein